MRAISNTIKCLQAYPYHYECKPEARQKASEIVLLRPSTSNTYPPPILPCPCLLFVFNVRKYLPSVLLSCIFITIWWKSLSLSLSCAPSHLPLSLFSSLKKGLILIPTHFPSVFHCMAQHLFIYFLHCGCSPKWRPKTACIDCLLLHFILPLWVKSDCKCVTVWWSAGNLPWQCI